ncbi:hypothetical protein HNV11_00800 [Spirosoma taeanense]|uniref:Rhamnogalacturonase A/B/Epimerase-like pectate lyase domain-containing protein n=1 Tax=Spirosoma taeanense TaxID=2735870 RepID=A0A6M5Y5P2_9BACT|nr:right-handed parallel beta-helix repeat-containing protein [Spirosoma taeanense]QJW88012.1 hypothetical protein HNV11_00800 [Spirosoma taeanense]
MSTDTTIEVSNPPMTLFSAGRLRLSATSLPAVYITDSNKQGIFTYDPSDLTTPHDGVMTIVTITNKRYKRQMAGLRGMDASWFGLKGDGKTDNTAAFTTAKQAAVLYKLPLIIPAGQFLFKTTATLASGLTLKGAGMDKTIFTFGNDFSGKSLFEGVGCSNLTLEDFSITGIAKELEAGIRLNSFPNHATAITLNRLKIIDFWGHGIMLGGSGPKETHFNEEVTITNCRIHRIGQPGALVIKKDSDELFHGIHLNQTTKKLLIQGNFITDCSGDGIFAWQFNNPADQEASAYQIKDNFIARTWMGIEMMSFGANNKSQISDNIVLYPNRNYGFGISVTGDFTDVSGNLVATIERIPLELGMNRGTVSNNRLVISLKKTSEEIGSDTFDDSGEALALAQLYNNAVKFTGNLGYVEARRANGTLAPKLIRGVEIVGKHGEFPPTVFTDYASYPDISDNSFFGLTGAAVCALVTPIRKAQIRNNVFQLSDLRYDSGIIIYGFDWDISNNVFDLTGAAAPVNGNGLVKVHNTLQSNTGTRSQVHLNRFYAPVGWNLVDNSQYVSTINFFIDPVSSDLTVDLAGIKIKAQQGALTQQLSFFGAAPIQKPAPLTSDINLKATDNYGIGEQTIITNLQIRLQELETTLKKVGLQN